MWLSVWKNKLLASTKIFPLLILLNFTKPVLAHHPFGEVSSTELSALEGFVSGIGHPLLGPDHLLFILAIALVGLRRPKKWVLPLVAIGISGSAFVQFQPLPEFLIPWTEALVSLSLAIEGLIILKLLNPKWLLPMFALHGYLLGNTIAGVEPTPLIGYFLGLLIAQATLLLIVTTASKRIMNWLGVNGQKITAGIWVGIGLAFSWFVLT